jgi:hypothetical protein
MGVRMHYRKTLLALLAATVMLTAFSSVASAGRLSVSSNLFRVTWRSLEFESAALGTVRCPITLEGSYHARTMAKVNGALVGYITRAGIGTAGCTGGRATALAETLPWHIRYRSFVGTLPRIAEIVEDAYAAIRVNATASGTECGWIPPTNIRPMRIIRGVIMIGSGIIEVLRGLGVIPITGPGLCALAGEGNIAGEGVPTVLGTTSTKITVTLI